MLKDIVAANARDNYRLHLRFEDGVEGVVDLAAHLSFRGVFEPLKDPAYFARVRVDPELARWCARTERTLIPTFSIAASPG